MHAGAVTMDDGEYLTRSVERRRILLESWRRFTEVLPQMRRPWWAVLVWGGAVFVCGLGLLLGWLVARGLRYGPLLVEGVFVLSSIALMFAGFRHHRPAYRQRYGKLAYRQLFLRFLLPALVTGLAAGCFPLLVAGRPALPSVIAYAAIAYLLLSMRLLELRGKEIVWDVELRAFVYSVFPERGRVLTAGIFQWLRHPVYSGMMRAVFALALLRNNWSAFLCAACSAAGLWLWARAEERDLEQQDAAYAAYRRRVPAFFAMRPVRFWRFLATGDTG